MTIVLPDHLAQVVKGALRGVEIVSLAFADSAAADATQTKDPEASREARDQAEHSTQRAEMAREALVIVDAAIAEHAPAYGELELG